MIRYRVSLVFGIFLCVAFVISILSLSTWRKVQQLPVVTNIYQFANELGVANIKPVDKLEDRSPFFPWVKLQSNQFTINECKTDQVPGKDCHYYAGQYYVEDSIWHVFWLRSGWPTDNGKHYDGPYRISK